MRGAAIAPPTPASAMMPDRGRRRPRADPLTPHECRQQAEQEQSLHVGQLGPDERRGHDRQRDERERGRRPASVAHGRPATGERQYRGGVEDEHRRAHHDHHAHVVVGAQVGDQGVGQQRQPVLDPVGGARDAHVLEPVPAQPRDREGEEEDDDRRCGRRHAALARDQRHGAGHHDRQRQQPEQAPPGLGAHQRRPSQQSVAGQRGERRQAHPRPLGLRDARGGG